MRCFSRGVAFAVVCLPMLLPSGARARPGIDLEAGVAFSGYNDVRIPGDSGTEFSLSEELSADPTAFFRVRLSTTFGYRHTVSVLAAPLRIRSEGTVDRDVLFEEETFDAGTPLEALFRFDSYRLSYRYDFHRGKRSRAGVGLTAKIRNAAISIEGGGRDSEKTNTGFVPLINFGVLWRATEHVGLLLEGDALVGPQGRAEDVLLAAVYEPIERLRLKLGYRILEGGADVDEVYNFTLINYVALGVILTL